jgi:hypothetical protein
MDELRPLDDLAGEVAAVDRFAGLAIVRQGGGAGSAEEQGKHGAFHGVSQRK